MILYAFAATVGLLLVLWRLRRLSRTNLSIQTANRAKSEFLANISHELRTPLNAILGMTALLEETPLNDNQRGMMEIVRESSEALLELVNGVLDFAALEAGHVRLERNSFALRSCVASVISLIRPQTASKGLMLETSLGDDVPGRVVGDPLRLHQILLTLLENAVKFTQTGKVRLEISVTCGAGEAKALLFHVIDTGIGIDPAACDRLFTPFTQADSASTRRYAGTGLGLATVRRLVQLMQGSVGVQSELGRGSTFWFLLPLEVPEAASPPPLPERKPPARAAAPAPAHRGHILIVDDNPINRLVARLALERLGYVTDVVSGGEQALARLQQPPHPDVRIPPSFDAILLDCQMPEMDGYQTAAAIRRSENGSQHIPIIAFTAHSSPEDRQKCLACGMDDYLGKPLQIPLLKTTLERWVVTPEVWNSSEHATYCPAYSTPPGPPIVHSPTQLPLQRLPS